MFFIGIDPDMHTMPIVRMGRGLFEVGILRVSTSLVGLDAVKAMCGECHKVVDSGNFATIACVEAQEIYRGQTKNPRDIMHLAMVAGAAVSRFIHCAEMYFPRPAEWKGQVDKLAHHYRIAGKLRWDVVKTKGKKPYLYVPDKFPHLRQSDWPHVFDAIGLAMWAEEQYNFKINKTRLLGGTLT